MIERIKCYSNYLPPIHGSLHSSHCSHSGVTVVASANSLSLATKTLGGFANPCLSAEASLRYSEHRPINYSTLLFRHGLDFVCMT